MKLHTTLAVVMMVAWTLQVSLRDAHATTNEPNAAEASKAIDAMPPLPRAMQGEVVLGVVQVDFKRLTDAKIQQTLKALVADESQRGELVKWVQSQRDAMTEAGGRGLVVVLPGPDEHGLESPPLFLAAPLEPGENQALRRKLAEWTPAGVDYRITDVSEGYMRAVPQQNLGTVREGSPQRQLTFAQVAQAGKDEVAYVALLPNDIVRQVFRQQMGQQARMNPAMMPIISVVGSALDAKHIVVLPTLGDKPSVQLHAAMPDAQRAQMFKNQLQGAIQTGKGMLGMMLANEHPLVTDEDRARLRSFSTALDGIKIEQKDDMVHMTLDAEGLKVVTQMLVPAIVAERQVAHKAAARQRMIWIIMGIMTYAADHNSQAPDTLEQLVEGDYIEAHVLKHPVTGRTPGFRYTKPKGNLGQIKDPSATAILHELDEQGNVREDGPVGYLDGSVRD